MATISTFGEISAQNQDAATQASNSGTTVDNNGTLQPPTTTEPEATVTLSQPAASQPPATTETTPTSGNTPPPVETDDSEVTFDFGGTGANTAPIGTTEGNAANPASNSPIATPATQFNLDEEIKKADRVELLKKLGVSEFAIEMDRHIAGGGQPIDYLNAKAIDYNKVSDEELVKQNLRERYPSFQPEQIDRMYNRQYGVNDLMSEEDIQSATDALQAAAYDIRQTKIANQQKFQIANTPLPEKDEAYEQWKQSREQNEGLIKQIQDYYSTHPATKYLNESKRVTINFGEGVKPLNISIDNPELITTSMIDGGQLFLQRSLNEKGEPDVARQQLGAFFALKPLEAAQLIFNYGKSVGIKSKITENQNAQLPSTTAMGGQPEQKATYRVGTYGQQ